MVRFEDIRVQEFWWKMDSTNFDLTKPAKIRLNLKCIVSKKVTLNLAEATKVAKKEEKENEIIRLNPNQPKNTRN